MKNNECTICIVTSRGSKQIYRRDKTGWTQTCPKGKVRKMTAEQLLSHILPTLAAGNKSCKKICVEKDKKFKK